jgi:small multidrug resistance pump
MLYQISSVREAYVCLFFAISCEVVGTSAMKANAGFSSVGYTILMAIAYIFSFALMTLALEKLDLGVACAFFL